MSKSLVAALWVLAVPAASSPFIVRLGYGYWNPAIIILALCMSLPVIGCLVWTIVQERRDVALSFATWPLVVAQC